MRKWSLGLLLVGITVSAVADDWHTWRGPNGNGISEESGWNAESASSLWKKELGVGYSSVSVKGSRLYTMGNLEEEDVVYCLDAKTGREIWTYAYACSVGKYKGPRATPVVDGGNLYTVSRDGLVHCLDAESGKVRWKTDALQKSGNENIRWGIATSAIIEGNLILLNIGDSGMALDKSTGKVEWKSKGQCSYASPVVFDHKGKRLGAIFSAPGLFIVDVKTGKVIADIQWETKYDINGADPLMIDEKIFISSGYNRGCALFDFSSGKLKKLWESDILKNQFSSSVYSEGYIYGVDGQTKKKGFVRCIDVKDGSEKWDMPIGFGSLVAADGKLIALGEKGTLYFAEMAPEKYHEISTFETGLSQLCWTPPVLANGVVYCRNDKGTLVAVDVSK
jgi:outer membrane protein assembly factor BamB